MVANVELTHGDWFFVPKGVPYAYSAEPYGASLLHIYNGKDRENDGYPGGNCLSLLSR